MSAGLPMSFFDKTEFCFDKQNSAKVVNWISRKEKSFTRFHFITKQLIEEKQISCDTAILKSVETRFVSRHSMTERVIHTRMSTSSLPKMNTSSSGFTSSSRRSVWRYTPLCVGLCTFVSNMNTVSDTTYYEYLTSCG